MPVGPNITDNFPTFTIPVTSTDPIWVYCRQGAGTPNSHCGLGMVFAVNCGPDGSNTSFTAFQQAALAEGAALRASASSAALASATDAPSATDTATGSLTTAAYGGVTIPAEPAPSLVTDSITVGTSTWQTIYSSYIGSPEPTPVAIAGAVHTVVVGGSNGQLTYSPSNISAEPRDIVVFQFQQKNHTATQSSFADPCRILTNATTNEVVGLDSGFMPVDASLTDGFPTWNVTVNDTTPLWFYCKQHTPAGASHCGSGMVFAVNAVADSARNFTAFQNLAIQLNGTSANTSSAASPSTTPSGSTASDNGAVSFGSSVALAMGSVFMSFALLL